MIEHNLPIPCMFMNDLYHKTTGDSGASVVASFLTQNHLRLYWAYPTGIAYKTGYGQPAILERWKEKRQFLPDLIFYLTLFWSWASWNLITIYLNRGMAWNGRVITRSRTNIHKGELPNSWLIWGLSFRLKPISQTPLSIESVEISYLNGDRLA